MLYAHFLVNMLKSILMVEIELFDLVSLDALSDPVSCLILAQP